MVKNKVNLKQSLAGFNMSPRSDRTTVQTFLDSYLEAFPDSKADLDYEFAELEDWLIRMLSKPRVEKKSKPPKTKGNKQAHIPPDLYIPAYPSPRRSYNWQAANIARDMRQKLEAKGLDTLD